MIHRSGDDFAQSDVRPDDRSREFSPLCDPLGLPDDLLFKTIWESRTVEKSLGRREAAPAAFPDLAASRNPYQVQAFEELAKFCEHKERNCAMALEMTRSALAIEGSPALRRHEERLK
jgi:hypothetical protein